VNDSHSNQMAEKGAHKQRLRAQGPSIDTLPGQRTQPFGSALRRRLRSALQRHLSSLTPARPGSAVTRRARLTGHIALAVGGCGWDANCSGKGQARRPNTLSVGCNSLPLRSFTYFSFSSQSAFHLSITLLVRYRSCADICSSLIKGYI